MTQNQSWEQRMKNGQNKPSSMNMRLSDASKVQARPVSIGRAITKSLEYMRDHPVDFAISVGTFIAVKALVTIAFPVIAGIGAAMLTAGILGVGRTLNQEVRARNRRVDKLYKFTDNPNAEDLAKAKSIDIAGVIETGFKRAALTGILGSVVGMALTSLFEGISFGGGNYQTYGSHAFNMPGNAEYNKFLGDLAGSESKGNYTATNDFDYLGKYQFGEEALKGAGYYTFEGDSTDWERGDKATQKNTWEGKWTGKDGVHSRADFLNTPIAQENAVRISMAQRWETIVNNNLDDYVGKTVGGVEITKSGLLAGDWLKGFGGLRSFLESGVSNADGYGTQIASYIEKFGGHEVPFEIDNPDQVPFYPAHSADCQSTISHTWPVDPNVTVTTGDEYGMRHHPVFHKLKMHTGLDIPAPAGTDVLASADGTVHQVNRGYNGGWGNQVIIQHEDGNFSTYNHLSNIQVMPGQEVIMGQDIGGVGTTGVSTGNHLHYELRADTNGNGVYDKGNIDKSYNPKSCITDASGKGRVLVNTYIASNAPAR